ncbi:hypothetical protein [Caballeronia sp. SEWSISQ10-4 2]|nr:hypothetical protein [Caballeronia sp. SEWSISQ10-4 2]
MPTRTNELWRVMGNSIQRSLTLPLRVEFLLCIPQAAIAYGA